MPNTSDFAKTCCFKYLTSPILAASCGGQAYEISLPRFHTKKHKSTANSVTQILGLKHPRKTYTLVTDTATQWYSCHLQQLRKAMERECQKEAEEREKVRAAKIKARQQALLDQHNAVPICCAGTSSQLRGRERALNEKYLELLCEKKQLKCMSPECEDVLLQNILERPFEIPEHVPPVPKIRKCPKKKKGADKKRESKQAVAKTEEPNAAETNSEETLVPNEPQN